MASKKDDIDPTDAPDPSRFIPSMPGGREDTPRPATPRDPGDVDSDLPPTASGAPAREAAPPAEDPPAEDPKALARRLAAEAKARAAAAAQAAEDPKALAKRLAAEAKARAAAAAQAAEDPKALARRLAAEAKARAAASAPEQAKAAPKTAPAPPKKAPSAPRAPRKKRSAAEILAEARQKDQAAKQAPPARAAETPPAPAPQQAAPVPDATAQVDPEQAITDVLRGATVQRVARPAHAAALKAVWQAHLARAQASDDTALAVTASSILGTLQRVGAEGIAAAEVRHAGQEHAVFVDTTTGALIGVAVPAHVYLAGVG